MIQIDSQVIVPGQTLNVKREARQLEPHSEKQLRSFASRLEPLCADSSTLLLSILALMQRFDRQNPKLFLHGPF
jgi:hypothetical protein